MEVTGGNIFLLSSDDNNDGDLLTVTESGNLGIGTTTPQRSLHVSGGNILLDNTRPLQWIDNTGTIRSVLNTESDGSVALYGYQGNSALRSVNGATYLYNTGTLVAGLIGTGLSLGTSYATQAPPSNGLLVEGSIGVGTTTPSHSLNLYTSSYDVAFF